jgi:hypothetical protein
MSSVSIAQTADLGLSREYLEDYLKKCGYWANPTRRSQLSYNLSPSAYVATHKQEDELERLARATYAAVYGLNLKLIKYAQDTKAGNEAARLVKLANNAARGLLKPIDGEDRIPPMIKIDLIQDPNGKYWIAEVDTYNPRGFGFAAMLEESLEPTLKVRRFPGMAQVARILKTNGIPGTQPWFVLVSDFERFYRPTYELFSDSLKRNGIHAPTIEATTLYDGLRDTKNIQMQAGVFCIPDTLFKEDPAVRELLLSFYKDGVLKAVYPPVAYLGSKAFLPYLRGYPEMDQFIPKTALVGMKYQKPELHSLGQKEMMLKAAVSSGMKGVYFSDLDGDQFTARLEEARAQRNSSWILQEQVEQTPLPIVVFDEEGKRVTRDYYLRVTAYISVNGIVDVEVTGRPDRKVHGAPDCIQIPVILS